MSKAQKIIKLRGILIRLYLKNSKKLLFHGWHHVNFVSKKAGQFAKSIGADRFLVESAGLTHDLNYIIKPNSEPHIGRSLRERYLTAAHYDHAEITQIEKIIIEAHTRTRTAKISKNAQALSDGDSLFKALPITPILFTDKYINQNKVSLKQLAQKIVSEQNKLLAKGIYFYTPLAKKKYLRLAKINISLWSNVKETLKDKDVLEMLSIAKKLKIL